VSLKRCSGLSSIGGLVCRWGCSWDDYRKLESFLDIYMTALLAVPMISFIPFLVIAFGLGLHSASDRLSLALSLSLSTQLQVSVT